MIDTQSNREYSPASGKMSTSRGKFNAQAFSDLVRRTSQDIPGLNKQPSKQHGSAVFIDSVIRVVDDIDDDCSHASSIISLDEELDATVTISNNKKSNSAKSPKKKKTKSKKSKLKPKLRFSPYDDVFEIPHIDDFPQEEVDSMWFVSEELQAMREECVALCARLDESEDVDFCIRGLDQHTKKYNEKRYAIQKIVSEGVFKIMQYQSNANIDVTQVISQLYQNLSASSVAAAAEIGRMDAFAAHGTD